MEAGLEKPKVCGTCGAGDAPLKCPCKAVFYCNTECQGASWREHRKVCTWDLERKLERQRDRLGGDDLAIGNACFDLGVLYYQQTRLLEAEEHYLEALRIICAVEGEGSVNVANGKRVREPCRCLRQARSAG
uniref:MYND-type domain-containing protein n=1 Tax=Hemiselmis andersenii TaxID=464988 RepID=A0A7S1GVI6_HEMAN|mmetsp:Transcript_17049/g.41077  ORF Transcript_17049/g.41077 Transcript_17049/m.41077 type:complete len:132 (+) Transcript_17049:54-449(+)